MKKLLIKLLLTNCIGLLFFSAGHIIAAPLNLPDQPMFLGQTVTPNVFIMLDDSGSMDWEIMTPSHWHFCAYDSNALGASGNSDCFNKITNSRWRSRGNGSYQYFEYIYANSDNAFGVGCNGGYETSVELCTEAVDMDWRVRSHDFNRIYYNPDNDYLPWKGPCTSTGIPCADANFTAVRSDPRLGNSGYNDLHDLGNTLFPIVYEVWIDNRGFNSADGRPRRGTNINVTTSGNGIVDLWDDHISLQFNLNTVSVIRNRYSPNTTGLNATNTVQAILTDHTACYNILGPNNLVQSIYNGAESYTSVDGAGCRTISQAHANLANWYQYHRRRSFAAKASMANLIDEFPYFRYGLSVINKHDTLFTEIPNTDLTDYTDHNETLLHELFSFDWPAAATPLRQGLERAGNYYYGQLDKPSPILYSCQQNFTMLLTDGYWNGSAPSVGNIDGDDYSATLADVGHYFYMTDLSPLDNNIVPNHYDPATHQHMVTYSISFGLSGLLQDTDGDNWPNPVLSENSNWGNPFNSDLEKVDDLWHSAFNSKGIYVAADSPEDLFGSIKSALLNISSRTGSISSVAQSNRMLSTASRVYQSTFNSFDWQGHLLAYDFKDTGELNSVPEWDSGCLLSGGDCSLPIMDANNNPGLGTDERVILTKGTDTTTVPFRWNSLTTEQTNMLLSNGPYPSANTSAEILANQLWGEQLIDYLRGSQVYEQQSGGEFRDRTNILGDFMHSSPIYIGPPQKIYPDSLSPLTPYSAFKLEHQARDPMIYIGSNAGMIHGFNAKLGDSQEGQERFAYVPGNKHIYENLAQLSDPDYEHRYFIDGALMGGDVFVNDEWKTIITGGYRSGAQGIYALNVTDPDDITETNSNQLLLWEFTDEDDPDLGFVYSKPQIARMSNDKWAVILSNGYNNSVEDGVSTTSATGQAALFILFIEQGMDGQWLIDEDYIKINVGPHDATTPNGLGDIAVIDENMDYRVDYVYGGDLLGNMWRFDLRSTVPANWSNSAQLLFTANHVLPGEQAITTQPIVTVHPYAKEVSNGVDLYGRMVYFGTGRYLEEKDNTSEGQATQSFYAIWDKPNSSLVTRDQLLSQNIIAEQTQAFDINQDGIEDSSFKVRATTDYPIDWDVYRGWVMDLKVAEAASNYGERVIASPIFRNGKIVITTFAPTNTPCDFGGQSWLMELDAVSGARMQESPFDFNEDEYFTQADFINIGDTDGDGQDNYVPASGIQSEVGITATPTVFATPEGKTEIKVLSGTSGIGRVVENPGDYPGGRQNWRRLIKR